jgi:hypothetical protein
MERLPVPSTSVGLPLAAPLLPKMTLSYEAEQQIVKAIRSLPWYMFLVPALFTLLISLFEPSILTDTRPESGYWALMWSVAKLGLFH